MVKNAIISFLLMAMLFMTETYQSYFSIALYISMVIITFAGICWIECCIDSEKRKYRAWKKFNAAVNEKISLTPPTKVS